MLHPLFLLSALLLSSPPARAMDCARANTPTEKLICARPELRALDAKINTLYGRLSKGQANKTGDSLRAAQRVSLTARDQCERQKKGAAFEKDCPAQIEAVLRDNLAHLEELAEAREIPNPSALYYDRLISFSEQWGVRGLIGEGGDDASGTWETGCQAHNCGAKSFRWQAKGSSSKVWAIADTGFDGKCDPERIFYVVTNAEEGKVPAAAVPALKKWSETKGETLCPARALFYDASQKAWRPLEALGSQAQGEAKAVNERIAAADRCESEKDLLKKALCRDLSLEKKVKAFETARAKVAASVPATHRARLQTIVDEKAKARARCGQEAGPVEVVECLRTEFENGTEDFSSSVGWTKPASAPELDGNAWLADGRKLPATDVARFEAWLRRADPSFDVRNTLELSADQPLPKLGPIEIATFDQSITGMNGPSRIVAVTRKLEELPQELLWLGVFRWPSGGPVRLTESFAKAPFPCAGERAWAVEPSPTGPLRLKEQNVSSCGSSVFYDFRHWECEGDPLVCLPVSRSEH